MAEQLMTALDAFILGVVEGITEYLPISSTGHLIVASELLGLRDPSHSPEHLIALQAFEIVIQSGAILAVLILYRQPVCEMLAGICGRSVSGLRMFINLILATLPIVVFGFLLKGLISTHLQHMKPVLAAMVLGGLVMLGAERFFRWRHGGSEGSLSIAEITPRQALTIGFFQCLALWPGMSRSMVTILGGMSLGLGRAQAAEYSFLLGLPALLLATLYKGFRDGSLLMEHVGISSLMIGLLTSALFAALAVRFLVRFLTRHGLGLFGWYRILAAGVFAYLLWA